MRLASARNALPTRVNGPGGIATERKRQLEASPLDRLAEKRERLLFGRQPAAGRVEERAFLTSRGYDREKLVLGSRAQRKVEHAAGQSRRIDESRQMARRPHQRLNHAMEVARALGLERELEGQLLPLRRHVESDRDPLGAAEDELADGFGDGRADLLTLAESRVRAKRRVVPEIVKLSERIFDGDHRDFLDVRGERYVVLGRAWRHQARWVRHMLRGNAIQRRPDEKPTVRELVGHRAEPPHD